MLPYRAWLGENHRDWDDLTVVTTLLHLFAVTRSLPVYSLLVLATTATSFAWHRTRESNMRLGLLDYGLAGVWFFADASLNWQTIPLNLAIALLHTLMADHHAAWHLLSAAKAIAVTQLLLTG